MIIKLNSKFTDGYIINVLKDVRNTNTLHLCLCSVDKIDNKLIYHGLQLWEASHHYIMFNISIWEREREREREERFPWVQSKIVIRH
jgi:hypothetical protein